MIDQATTARKCSRCGTAVESCAFCDEPGCPALLCDRCVNIVFLERPRPKTTTRSSR